MIVRETVHVSAPPESAFSLFTDGIGRWWPLHEGFSYGQERASGIFLEARVGGRFYERFVDGDEFQVGQVTECDPPDRIVFTWRSPDWDGPTEVEVTFTADGGGTRVDLEHRGWERIGPKGDELGGMFGNGWPRVMAAYAEHAG